MKKAFISIFVCAVCLVLVGCGGEKENGRIGAVIGSVDNETDSIGDDDIELVESSDGYIYVACDVYHKLRNNLMDHEIREFDEKYDGKKFAITGTLRYDLAFDKLFITAGERYVEGGSGFDYAGILRSLGVDKNIEEYDGKNVIIRGTFKQVDMIEGFNARRHGSLHDCTIEVVK